VSGVFKLDREKVSGTSHLSGKGGGFVIVRSGATVTICTACDRAVKSETNFMGLGEWNAVADAAKSKQTILTQRISDS